MRHRSLVCGGGLEGLVAAAWLYNASLHPVVALNEALSRPPCGPRSPSPVPNGPSQGLHVLT